MPYHDSAGTAGRSAHLAALGALLLALASPPAWAESAGYLGGTRVSRIDQKDIDALNSTALVVLNTKNDGETSRWTRPASPDRPEVSATLTPEGTSIKHRRTCRFVAMTVQAGPHAIKLRPQYCRTPKTPWELQGAQ